MKKFAFLILSLALTIGCQPADDSGTGGGGTTPATDDAGTSDDADTSDDSASTEDGSTKMVALKVTSELR